MDPHRRVVTTNLCGMMESAGQLKQMCFDRISNTRFNEKEVAKYHSLRKSSNLTATTELVLKRFLMRRKNLMDECKKEGAGKKKTNFDKHTNLTRATMDAKFHLRDCLAKGDEDGAKAMRKKLQTLDKKEKKRKMLIRAQKTRQIIHKVNVRNVDLSVARMELAAKDAKVRAKTDIMDKEFYLHSTRPSRPGILWQTNEEQTKVAANAEEDTEEEKMAKNKAIYLAQQSGRPNSGSTGTSGEGDVAGTQDANGIVEQNAAKALFQVSFIGLYFECRGVLMVGSFSFFFVIDCCFFFGSWVSSFFFLCFLRHRPIILILI